MVSNTWVLSGKKEERESLIGKIYSDKIRVTKVWESTDFSLSKKYEFEKLVKLTKTFSATTSRNEKNVKKGMEKE